MRPLFLLAASWILATTGHAQDFRHPSACGDGCMVVTAYFDYGGSRDWSCGTVTYAGHRGTDFAPYGRFAAMDEGRDVVAAAEGEVIAAHDGEFDRCTSGACAGGGGFGNHVAVRHPDGRVTYYAHLRRGSVAVGVGARVSCGQVVGQIGSSGYSTGPHLHFEPRTGGTADDPFGGVSGCSGPESWWVEQRDYRSIPADRCATAAPPEPAPEDDAATHGVETLPATELRPGEPVQARVRMRNTGNTTWSDEEELLLTFDGGEPMGGPDQVRLGDVTVAPDTTHEFVLALSAPETPGEHSAFYRMDRFGTARFGARAEVRLVVTADAPEPPIEVEPDPQHPPPEDIAPGDVPYADPRARPGTSSERLVGRCSVSPIPAGRAPGAALFGLLSAALVLRRGRRGRSGG